MSKAAAGKAVRVLDLLPEFFGEDGAHWTRGRYHDGHSRRCLIGALDFLRRKHRIGSRERSIFCKRQCPIGGLRWSISTTTAAGALISCARSS
jgi:hypothetical protein